jgi:hypothetical protein
MTVLICICETDEQLATIVETARRQVKHQDRARFLELIGRELPRGEVGDGAVSRAINQALRFIRRNPERTDVFARLKPRPKSEIPTKFSMSTEAHALV